MSTEKLYADRDIIRLDEDGNYYCKHVMAMTAESLHSKSDIAAELGYRDREIAELIALVVEIAEGELEDGEMSACIDYLEGKGIKI